MIAGHLREQITIEQSSLSDPSNTGKRTKVWSTYAADVPANVKAVTGTKFDFASSYTGTTNYQIVIRYIPNEDGSAPGVTNNMRVNLNGRTMAIYAVKETDEFGRYEDRKRWLTLLCTEQPGVPMN